MELAKSQKIVKVLGILDIIGAVITFIMAIGMFGVGVAGAGTSEFATDTDIQQGVGAFLGIGIAMVVMAVVSLLEGIFSLRAAKDASKVKPLWIFAIIGVVLAVINLIMSFTNGGESVGSNVFSLLFSCATFYLANNIKKKAA